MCNENKDTAQMCIRDRCVDNIMQIWRDGEADKLTQLVFCDISTPQAKAPVSKAAKTLDNPCLLYTSHYVTADEYLSGNVRRKLRQAQRAAQQDPVYAVNVEAVSYTHLNQMLLSEKLYPHLLEIDATAQSRLEQMMPQLAKEAGATAELKASNPMKWVGLMLSLIHI